MAPERKSTCRVCGERIFFVKCSTGQRIPLEEEPVWIRICLRGRPYYRRDGTAVFGEIIGDAYDMEDPDTELLEVYQSHYIRCPEGGRPRRKRERKREAWEKGQML